MTGLITPNPGTDAPVVGTPAPVDASAKPAGTPAPAAAEAAGKGKVYDEAFVKGLIADRDAAKAKADAAAKDAERTFMASERGKKVAEAERRAAEAEIARQKQAEAEALARGEHEKVIASHKSRIAELETAQVTAQKQRAERDMRRDFETAYRAVGGLDPSDAEVAYQKAVADGTINVDESGRTVGVSTLITKLVEARPRWFQPAAGEAVKRLGADANAGAQRALDDRELPGLEDFGPGGVPSLGRPPKSWATKIKDKVFGTG